MTKKRWHSHGGGGNVVVTDSLSIWIGQQIHDTGPRFTLLERALLPPEPIAAVAVDAGHLVAATGHVSWDDVNGAPESSETSITVIDLATQSIVASNELPYFGGYLGICGGYVLTWFWAYQGDVLTIDSPMRLDGEHSPYMQSDFDDFVHCDTFGVYGDTMAGSAFYEGNIHLASPGSKHGSGAGIDQREPLVIAPGLPVKGPHCLACGRSGAPWE